MQMIKHSTGSDFGDWLEIRDAREKIEYGWERTNAHTDEEERVASRLTAMASDIVVAGITIILALRPFSPRIMVGTRKTPLSGRNDP